MQLDPDNGLQAGHIPDHIRIPYQLVSASPGTGAGDLLASLYAGDICRLGLGSARHSLFVLSRVEEFARWILSSASERFSSCLRLYRALWHSAYLFPKPMPFPEFWKAMVPLGFAIVLTRSRRFGNGAGYRYSVDGWARDQRLYFKPFSKPFADAAQYSCHREERRMGTSATFDF